MEKPTAAHFDELAERYATLRASDAYDDPVTAAVVKLGRLRRSRVLDAGCGPGTVAARLAREFGAKASGVDLSRKMIDVARQRHGGDADFRVAAAEELPFENATFDAVVMRMTVHLLDRPAAFFEIARVLRMAGRLVITTTDPARVGAFWMAQFFPSYGELERSRFPSAEALESDLRGCGFSTVSVYPFVLRRRFSRDEALAKLYGRAYSTFALMTEDEYRAGLAAAEESLPVEVEYDLCLLNLVADK
jgi:ubiquinone/menaquinone biosynthesis C-methylase UbiE